MGARETIITWSGKLVNPLCLRQTDIEIRDIAWPLARICRYGGQATKHYSVAEHCVHVSKIVERHARLRGYGPDSRIMAQWGLIHDAPEAYLGDVVRPIKARREFDGYRAAETDAMAAIARWFGMPDPTGELPEIVEEFDKAICGDEMRALFPVMPDDLRTRIPDTVGAVICAWSPERAYEEWCARFVQLSFLGEPR